MEKKITLNAVIGGASHNKKETRKAADEETIKKAIKYQKRGLCVSLKYIRAHDDKIGDDKFLKLVMGNLSSVDLGVFNSNMNSVEQYIGVGSKNVIIKIEAVRDSLKLDNEQMRGVEEPKKPFLAGTYATAFPYINKEVVYIAFVPQDTPFFFDYSPYLYIDLNSDIGALVDFNCKERVFSESGELFKRNWYFKGVRDDGSEINFKEPNFYLYRYGVLEKLMKRAGLLDDVYDKREAGDIDLGTFVGLMGRNVFKHPIATTHSLGSLAFYFSRKWINKKRNQIRYFEKIEDGLTQPKISLKALGNTGKVTFDAFTEVIAENTNPFLARDIDDIYDWIYHRSIYELAVKKCEKKYGKKDAVKEAFKIMHPEGEKLYKLHLIMGEVNKMIPMLENSPEYENSRIDDLIKILKEREKHQLPNYGLEIKHPFDSKGNFIAEPSPGDKIPESLAYLEKKVIEYKQKHQK